MNKNLKNILLLLIIFNLNACDSHTRVRNQPIVLQLNQFIGQTPDAITQQLNLQNISINFIKQPVLKDNQLIYTFQRRVSTPIPTGIATRDEKNKMMQTQIATTSDSIQNTLNCNIIFDIESGIAKSYRFQGRGC